MIICPPAGVVAEPEPELELDDASELDAAVVAGASVVPETAVVAGAAVVAAGAVVAGVVGGGAVVLLALSSSPHAANTIDTAASTAPTCRTFILGSPLFSKSRPRFRAMNGRSARCRPDRTYKSCQARARTLATAALTNC
jgi:hypothetical protein